MCIGKYTRRFMNIQVTSKCLNTSSCKLHPHPDTQGYIDINNYINCKNIYNTLYGIIYKLYETVIYFPIIYPSKLIATLAKIF